MMPTQNGDAPCLHLVLIEPQIPQNTGNIARTCAVTGAHLHLVKPMGFTVTDAKLKRAGLDYWDKLSITYHDSTEDFLRYAEQNDIALFLFTTKASRLYTEMDYPKKCALVFGREDAGLCASLRERFAEQCVRFPMREELRSLNLSNAVAIGAYEVLRRWGFEGMR